MNIVTEETKDLPAKSEPKKRPFALRLDPYLREGLEALVGVPLAPPREENLNVVPWCQEDENAAERAALELDEDGCFRAKSLNEAANAVIEIGLWQARKWLQQELYDARELLNSVQGRIGFALAHPDVNRMKRMICLAHFEAAEDDASDDRSFPVDLKEWMTEAVGLQEVVDAAEETIQQLDDIFPAFVDYPWEEKYQEWRETNRCRCSDRPELVNRGKEHMSEAAARTVN
jgi:hypothetical protein